MKKEAGNFLIAVIEGYAAKLFCQVITSPGQEPEHKAHQFRRFVHIGGKGVQVTGQKFCLVYCGYRHGIDTVGQKGRFSDDFPFFYDFKSPDPSAFEK